MDKLHVYIGNDHVGTLALKDGRCAFQYTQNWINKGFSLDPINLKLSDKLYISEYEPFEGLFGVFYDSMPDGWGRLLVDRMLASQGMKSVDVLHRLAIVGKSGHGSIEYIPEFKFNYTVNNLSYDRLAEECSKILNSKDTKELDLLYDIGGSSGGARPKAFVDIEGEPWIVKFKSSNDPDNIGEQEKQYFDCAKKCGIEVPETKLIKSNKCSGYFAIKRFDRVKDKKIHMISASALLGVSHRIPSLDYIYLINLTFKLTEEIDQAKQMYKLMCFNVFAHNRDDHSNNFSFLYDGKWKLSPAYDLTYSFSINGEHATTINGNGVNPDITDILEVAKNSNLNVKWARNTALEIKDIVRKNIKF